jgi:hypothetical protein
MHQWIIYADRRRGNPDAARTVLEDLVQGVTGLTITYLDDVEEAPDHGKFRDFAPIARAQAQSEKLLAWLLDELVGELGWGIDVSRGTSQE